MKQHQAILTITTRGGAFHDISAEVERTVRESGIRTGLCVAFLRHTFAAYSTLTRLERLGELSGVDPAQLTADERALLDELRADPAVGRFLRLS